MSKLARILLFLVALASLAALAGGPASAQETTTIAVGDNWFCDSSFAGGVCETTINAGDTVVWDFSGASNAHTVTECGDDCANPTSSPAFDSGQISDGSTFQHTFDEARTLRYACQVHGASTMQGTIIVQDTTQPTATVPAGGTPLPTSTVSSIPETGAGASGDSNSWWLLALLGSVGVAAIWLGAVAYRKVRAED